MIEREKEVGMIRRCNGVSAQEEGIVNGDVTVKKLLLIGFGLAILLVVGLSSVSLWQFQGNKAGVVMLTQSDMPLALTLGEIKNNILMHRRYEKDFLLNIGNAEKQ